MAKKNPVDSWPTLKGNNLRNSNSLLPGKIIDPKVIMETHFGNFMGYFKLKTCENTLETALEAPRNENACFEQVERKYGFNGINYGVNGKIFHRHDFANYRLFNLYSADELNLVYVTEGLELHNNRNSLVVCRVLNEKMETEIIWEVELPYYHERPHILVDDMNRDGVAEIIVEGWEGITVYDIHTHQPIMDFPQELLHNSRKRGYVMTRDLNHDGLPEIVILSCYPWDVNVINNDGRKLTTNWYKIYDNHIESAKIITSYIRTPVYDYNNDGREEMVFNIWNEKEDGQWHVKILDAFTGNEILDIPEAYIHDAVDIDNDGKLELFLSRPAGIDVPEFSSVFIRHIDGRLLYSMENSKWACGFDSFPDDRLALHPGQESKHGLKYLVCDGTGGSTAFFVYTDTGDRTFITRHTAAGCDTSFRISFPRGNRLDILKAHGTGQLLLCWETKYKQPEGVKASGIDMEALCWGVPQHQQLKLPVIARLNEVNNSIVIPNSVGQVVCYGVTEGKLQERWHTDGYGAAEQYKGYMDFGVVVDDFLGNGENQVAVRVNGKGGGIKLVDCNGKNLWETDFPLIPSGQPCGFRGILGYYSSAAVQGKKVLVVSGQRNVQHTGITYGLDGKSGKQLWMLETIRKGRLHESGAGSFYITAWDMDGDGVDEVLTGYGNNVWAAKADTGEVLFQNFMRGFWEKRWIRDYRCGWVASISPMPVSRDGKTSVFFFGNAGDSNGTAVIDINPEKDIEEHCKLLWGNEKRIYTDRMNQCELIFNNSKLIVEPALLNGKPTIHVLDPISGADVGPVYTLEGKSQAVPIACDIDGDNIQEIVYTADRTLCALRFTGEDWKTLWKLDFPTVLSWPVYGDINGDGSGEIVITGANGALYVVG